MLPLRSFDKSYVNRSRTMLELNLWFPLFLKLGGRVGVVRVEVENKAKSVFLVLTYFSLDLPL